ncbi:MAG: insulinase family protein [Butyricicoccus pullicaecorum]|nr:insulinase family protein [Butyricicoccus pullicaecorum]
MQNMTQQSLGEGIQLTCITTAQFKTAAFSAAFVLPLAKENAAAAILPYLLYCGTERYPNLSALGQALDGLYGVRIEPYVRKSGESLVIGFLADSIDASCVPDGDSLTEQVARLLAELLCCPVLEQGRFAETAFVSEQANLKDRIAALKNNPSGYAVRRAQEIMCDGEAFGACEYGTEQGAQALTMQAVWQTYQEILRTARVELFYCGTAQAALVAQAYQKGLKLPERAMCYRPQTDACRLNRAPRTVTEEMQVVQGKLTLGLRTGLTGAEEQYPALMLFTAVLGGYTGSRLFCHVREKRSLCYYATASLDKLKGIMMIASGIENEKYQEALSEILRQIEDLHSGGLTQEELDNARRTVIHNVRSMQDSPLSLEYYWQRQAIAGCTQTPEELIACLSRVERGQVMTVGRHIGLDLIYFIKGVGV